MAIVRKLEKKPQDDFTPPKKVRKVDRHAGHDESNWLISYADMMTLLCVFYIMMFSMSKINTAEFEKVKKEVSEHFGTKYESPTADLGKFINNVITETGVTKEAIMTSDGVSVSIAFHSTLFFDTMSAEISKAGKEVIFKVAAGLAEQQKKSGKNYKIVVEGHTDSQPIVGGPFPSNWELSGSRATRVVRLFLEKNFAPENLLAIGYADTQPIVPSRNSDGTWNEANLAKNRRVVLRVLMPEVDSIPWRVKGTDSTPDKTKPASPVTPVKDLKSTTAVVAPPTVAPVVAKAALPVAPSVVAVPAKPVEAKSVIAPVAPVIPTKPAAIAPVVPIAPPPAVKPVVVAPISPPAAKAVVVPPPVVTPKAPVAAAAKPSSADAMTDAISNQPSAPGAQGVRIKSSSSSTPPSRFGN